MLEELFQTFTSLDVFQKVAFIYYVVCCIVTILMIAAIFILYIAEGLQWLFSPKIRTIRNIKDPFERVVAECQAYHIDKDIEC